MSDAGFVGFVNIDNMFGWKLIAMLLCMWLKCELIKTLIVKYGYWLIIYLYCSVACELYLDW